MPLTQVNSGLLESGAALANIGSGNITPAYLNTQAQYTGFKNRIINGAMVIDQRNAGAAVTVTNGGFSYTVDRWFVQNDTSTSFSCQRSTDVPNGSFTNSVRLFNTTAASPSSSQQRLFGQNIEGFNAADLGFGTSAAQSVTLSFWVKSTTAGTYGVAIENPTGAWSYIGQYTVNTVNTWEYKTITATPQTSGSWATNNAAGLGVYFDLGCGTSLEGTGSSWNNADRKRVSGNVNLFSLANQSLFITGVQLEKGSTATSFDYRPYGTELALCQRYFQIWNSTNAYPYLMTTATATNALRGGLNLIVPMRTSPTMTFTAGTTFYYQGNGNGVGIGTGTVTVQGTSSGGNVQSIYLQFPFASTTGAGYAVFEYSGSSIQASAEL